MAGGPARHTYRRWTGSTRGFGFCFFFGDCSGVGECVDHRSGHSAPCRLRRDGTRRFLVWGILSYAQERLHEGVSSGLRAASGEDGTRGLVFLFGGCSGVGGEFFHTLRSSCTRVFFGGEDSFTCSEVSERGGVNFSSANPQSGAIIPRSDDLPIPQNPPLRPAAAGRNGRRSRPRLWLDAGSPPQRRHSRRRRCRRAARRAAVQNCRRRPKSSQIAAFPPQIRRPRQTRPRKRTAARRKISLPKRRHRPNHHPRHVPRRKHHPRKIHHCGRQKLPRNHPQPPQRLPLRRLRLRPG